MNKHAGFTLIELLLVLAIIGIISAIAIPALLGQRARARDKACMANVDGCMKDLAATYDRVRDQGGPISFGNFEPDLWGTAAAPVIPEFWTASNPWNTAGATTGYCQVHLVVESSVTGTNTAAQCTVANLGQVQTGYLDPATGGPGCILQAVWLNAPYQNGAGNMTNVYMVIIGVD